MTKEMTTSEWIRKCLEYNNWDKKIVEQKYNDCCKELNKVVKYSSFERIIRHEYNKKYNNNVSNDSASNSNFHEKYEETSNSIKAERLFTRKPQSLDDVIEMFSIDNKIWECEKFTCSTWDVTSTKAKRTATNIAVKAIFKKRQELINLKELEELFKKNTIKYIPPVVKVSNIEKNNFFNPDNLLAIPIMDLHIAKLGWAKEVGIDFDHKIISHLFKESIKDTLDKHKNTGFGRILTLIGSDALNFDNMEGTTSGGTPQSNDLRWQKMIQVAMQLYVWAFDYMSNFTIVDVLWIPGNHDMMLSYCLACYLSAWYRNNDRVNINIEPTTRKYYEWGNVLLGHTHGDKEKKRIEHLMQVEASEAWGRTYFREFLMGHLHSEQTKEVGGIIFRNLSSLTGTDAWHYISGYVGAIRKLSSIIYNKNSGPISIVNSVVTSDGKDII